MPCVVRSPRRHLEFAFRSWSRLDFEGGVIPAYLSGYPEGPSVFFLEPHNHLPSSRTLRVIPGGRDYGDVAELLNSLSPELLNY